MFTGIIHDTGKIANKSSKGDSLKFSVKPDSNDLLIDVKTGDSIAINGACMTVENKSNDSFEFTAINESLSKTNLGKLDKNSIVNLEKAMTMNSKLDGHIVQGHIDTIGTIAKVNKLKDSHEFFVQFPIKFKDNIINVGSIAINGVSLTIAEIVEETPDVMIKVAIIPHTFNVTNFNSLSEGDSVNIEFDMLGKYVKRILNK